MLDVIDEMKKAFLDGVTDSVEREGREGPKRGARRCRRMMTKAQRRPLNEALQRSLKK